MEIEEKVLFDFPSIQPNFRLNHFFLQNSRAQKEKISNWRTMGKICLFWINICWTRNSWKIFLWIRTLELFYQRWRFGTRDSKFKTRNNKWKGSISVILVFFLLHFFSKISFFYQNNRGVCTFTTVVLFSRKILSEEFREFCTKTHQSRLPVNKSCAEFFVFKEKPFCTYYFKIGAHISNFKTWTYKLFSYKQKSFFQKLLYVLFLVMGLVFTKVYQ